MRPSAGSKRLAVALRASDDREAVRGQAKFWLNARVAEDGGKFRPMEVEAGRESANMTEIRKGLSAGQKVVASGQFLIDSESSLKTTLNRLQSEPAAPQSVPATTVSPQSPQHTATGKINRIDAKDGMLELTHAPIPAMKWPAMTMMFRAADKALLEKAKPGDEIEFDMLAEPGKDGDYVITRITPRAPRGTARGNK